MKTDNFAAFILTHGRPNNVKTFDTLRKHGYTGKIVLVIDDEDKTEEEYFLKYGKQVQVFSKSEIAKRFDEMGNFKDRKSIVYARNACFEIAKKMGIKWFIQLDDDYSGFYWRYDQDCRFTRNSIKNLDVVFDQMTEFVETTKTKTLCMAQAGDFLGGEQSGYSRKLNMLRKAMNSFICKTDNPIGFLGRINEDVNTYCLRGSRGEVFLTTMQMFLIQAETQSNSGGMTDIYKDNGTYVKSFYTVIAHPSSVVVSGMKSRNTRLHHQINWNKTVPKIISQTHKRNENTKN